MRIRTSLAFIAALAVGLAACGKRAEEPPAATQNAQTADADKSADAAKGPGTTTNFEAQPAPAEPTPAPGR